MSKIQNKPVCREAYVEKVRGAMHHRAQWLYLLLDEAKKRGADWEEIARAATSRCGCFQGAGLYEDWTDHTSLKSFAEVFADEDFKKYFDMEIVESTESSLQIKFHWWPVGRPLDVAMRKSASCVTLPWTGTGISPIPAIWILR